MLLIALLAMSSLAVRAGDTLPSAPELPTERNSLMSEQSMMIDLFDRWERVWHEGQFDLVPSCVGEHYIRHDENGDRTVTRDAYAAEIAKVRQERPDIRVVVYDHSFEGDRAWFRFAFKWTDTKTGEARSRAGMQSYRTEGGKLVETWLSMQPLGPTWADTPQEHWTSPAAIK
jgi:SnoaL-like domain